MHIPYPVLLYRAPEGGYVAEIPQLRGCLAQGETEMECLKELETVMHLWLETAKDLSIPLPDTNAFLDKLRSAVNA